MVVAEVAAEGVGGGGGGAVLFFFLLIAIARGPLQELLFR